MTVTMVKIKIDLLCVSILVASSTCFLVSLAISAATCDCKYAASVLLNWNSFSHQLQSLSFTETEHTKACNSLARSCNRFKESKCFSRLLIASSNKPSVNVDFLIHRQRCQYLRAEIWAASGSRTIVSSATKSLRSFTRWWSSVLWILYCCL
jgi:hypothetical protein